MHLEWYEKFPLLQAAASYKLSQVYAQIKGDSESA
jgi:hypothetical protein